MNENILTKNIQKPIRIRFVSLLHGIIIDLKILTQQCFFFDKILNLFHKKYVIWYNEVRIILS